ncbi:MAG: Zn-ribbon domain-containing OB-fold protein [Thermoleophilia bacterium]|nr:Zn-ribbon domain-containing OB-fold protein [Thermoleophilia bacterium]
MTVSAIEFTRLGAPKLHLYAMKCDTCGELSPWWERSHCYKCGNDGLTESELSGTGEITNYTVVYYPPREFLGQEPYVVGHILMDEGVIIPAPVMGVAPDDVEVGTRVVATLRRMKLGHEGDIYYSYKFVVDDDAPSPATPAVRTARAVKVAAASTPGPTARVRRK